MNVDEPSEMRTVDRDRSEVAALLAEPLTAFGELVATREVESSGQEGKTYQWSVHPQNR